jgi:hypothetical protein
MWKWYTYWGTLILQGSSWAWARRVFAWNRRVAAGLIYRPEGHLDAERTNPLVHLGFWALWASPEGFAGYDHQGNLWKPEQTSNPGGSLRTRQPAREGEGVLQSVLQEAEEAAEEKEEMEILVVGHSLGGAVSW